MRFSEAGGVANVLVTLTGIDHQSDDVVERQSRSVSVHSFVHVDATSWNLSMTTVNSAADEC